ncbi:MAG: N-acetyl-gamma-glutamyl-phosphate reductase [Myxococcota bacterium]|nr:N-acetyl-gamma-glutamyl-phosphate reductase [Myxococcota bacterium]
MNTEACSESFVSVAVVGATGYTGVELVRLLSAHPKVCLRFASSTSRAGSRLDALYPNAPPLELVDEEALRDAAVDVVFLCVPHAAAAERAATFLERGVRVIDLSADFRLSSASTYARWYARAHPCPQYLDMAVYGLTEWRREALLGARLVANPGCYPTSVLMALAPLVGVLPLDGVIIDAKSGVSGAGRTPRPGLHFVNALENLSPYKIGESHRHLAEMQEQLQQLGEEREPRLTFSPHLVPLRRGMLSTIYVPRPVGLSLETVRGALEDAYSTEQFVRLLPEGELATVGHVHGTNSCVISLSQSSTQFILVSAIDNLLKGAAGQAVQNLNAVHGWPENLALSAFGPL